MLGEEKTLARADNGLVLVALAVVAVDVVFVVVVDPADGDPVAFEPESLVGVLRPAALIFFAPLLAPPPIPISTSRVCMRRLISLSTCDVIHSSPPRYTN